MHTYATVPPNKYIQINKDIVEWNFMISWNWRNK